MKYGVKYDYLYFNGDENHWNTDPTKVKSFDSYKEAEDFINDYINNSSRPSLLLKTKFIIFEIKENDKIKDNKEKTKKELNEDYNRAMNSIF